MTAELLLRDLGRVAGTPDAITRLRRFLLDLAVSGRLVAQDASETPVLVADKDVIRRSKRGARESVSSLIQPSAAQRLPSGWTTGTIAAIAECLDYMRKPVNIEERNLRTAGKTSDELFPYYGATQQQGWIDDYLFDEELVLLGEDGVSYLDPFRHKAYVIAGKTWVNNHAHVLRAIHITSRFLELALNAFDYTGRVMGATRSKLNQGQMVSIPIPLPPRDEQIRIVAKFDELTVMLDDLEAAQATCEKTREATAATALSSLTTAIDGVQSEFDATRERAQFYIRNSHRLITSPEHLMGVRSAILDLAVRGRLAPHVEAPGGAVHTRQLLEEKAGAAPTRKRKLLTQAVPLDQVHQPFPLPETWAPLRLSDLLFSCKTGYGDDLGPNLVAAPVVKVGNIDNAGYFVGEFGVRGFTERELTDLVSDTGDLIVVKSSGSAANVHSGKAALCGASHAGKLVATNFTLRLRRFSQDMNVTFLWRVLNSPWCRSWVASRVQTMTYPNLTWALYGMMPIPIPPFTEQCQIVVVIDKLMGICDELERNLGLLQSQRLRVLEAELAECLATHRLDYVLPGLSL